MNVRNQKRMIAKLMKVGKDRVKFDIEKLPEIKEAITKADLRFLLSSGAIKIQQKTGHSKVRSRKIKIQKSKGRRKGIGTRKGRKTARLPRKDFWMSKTRSQRSFIKLLKQKNLISKQTYRDVYHKIKSNRFRSIRLIKLYIEENNLFNKNATKKKS